MPTETGVYLTKAGQWVEMAPEIVNWKTSGVIKTVATLGVIKGNVNGHVAGPRSPNAISGPPEFLIVTLEGVSVAEYQLVRMHANKDNREFRTVTGGIFHSESGAARDLVKFESSRMAPHAYRVALPSSFEAGEYGFLPPGSNGASGKVYSFSVTR